MYTEIISGEGVFERIRNEWDDLVASSATSTPFQSLGYQRAWWIHLGEGELYTVLTWGEEELLAIGCFYLVDRILYFNGGVEETDYLDLIASPAVIESAWRSTLDALEAGAQRGEIDSWDTLAIYNLPAASPSCQSLQQLAADRAYRFTAEIQEVCPIISLPDSFENYLMALDKKQRHEIRRKLRRADGVGAEMVTIGPEDDLANAVDDFLKLLQKSMPEKADWLTPGRRALFHEVAVAAMQQGTLQLCFLVHNGVPAAALYNFDYNGRIWVYNSGLDIVEFGYLSPGVVLTAAAIQSAVENGRESFDFLRGAETYKYRFGAVDTAVYRVQIDRTP